MQNWIMSASFMGFGFNDVDKTIISRQHEKTFVVRMRFTTLSNSAQLVVDMCTARSINPVSYLMS